MGSVGQWLGGIVGGVIGFFIGGWAGAAVGFSIGMGIGSIVDPTTPDIYQPGEPMKEIEVMTNKEGLPMPDVLGTTKLSGNLLWYGNNHRIETTEEVDTGKKSEEDVVTGYRYYLSWVMGICLGPVDTLYTIYMDEDVVWAGELERPEPFGMATLFLSKDYGEQISGTGDTAGEVDTTTADQILRDSYNNPDSVVIGYCYFYFGSDYQEANNTLGSEMLAAGTIADLNYNIPYRGQCYCYFYNCYIGPYNRAPTMKFVIKKAPDCSFDP